MAVIQRESSSNIVRPPVERETIRVGVIGVGFGANVHVPALRKVPGVQVAAICGTNQARLRDLSGSLSIPATFTDYRQLLQSGRVDAVTIATPPHLHHPMVLAACEAGLHVLCEKPMARNVAEARDMLRMARDAGICHGVGHQMRYEPVRSRMKELIDEGFIGRLHSVSITVFRSALADPFRRTNDWLVEAGKAGGILAAIGSHYVDLLRWWFMDIHAACGALATVIEERMTASTQGMKRADADDNTAFVVRFANGAIGSVHISYTATKDIGEQIIATGSDGILAIQENGKLHGSAHGGPMRTLAFPGSERHATSTKGGRHIRAFSTLAGEWIWAMRTGTEASPSFEDGVKVQEVIDAVARSQQLGRWVDLSGNKWPV